MSEPEAGNKLVTAYGLNSDYQLQGFILMPSPTPYHPIIPTPTPCQITTPSPTINSISIQPSSDDSKKIQDEIDNTVDGKIINL